MISGGRRVGPGEQEPASGAADKASPAEAAAPVAPLADGGLPSENASTCTPIAPDAAPVRTDMVNRMRWLLAAGEIGRDHAGLAESLIVSMARRS